METSLELFKTVLMTRDPRTRPLYFRLAWRREHNVLGQMTIHILPDDVLLEIFKAEYLLKPVVRRPRACDRLCEIDLTDASSEFGEQVGQMMQKPFPVLSELLIGSTTLSSPMLPDSFSGEPASRLRYSSLGTSHFRPYRIYSCLVPTFGILTFTLFHLLCISLPK